MIQCHSRICFKGKSGIWFKDCSNTPLQNVQNYSLTEANVQKLTLNNAKTRLFECHHFSPFLQVACIMCILEQLTLDLNILLGNNYD
jgi:hypothetical protein